MNPPVSLRFAAPLVVLSFALAGFASSPPLADERFNVVVITVDSLRADSLDFAPDGETPSLARLAREGAHFDNAWTVTPWTAPSIVSIFTGLEPPVHGVEVRGDTTPPALPTLAWRLGREGWKLGNFAFFSPSSYYRNLGWPPPPKGGDHSSVADSFLTWLDGTERPFLAWLHFLEPHLPYGAAGYDAPTARVCGSSGLERAQLAGTLPLADGYRFDAGDGAALRALYDEDVRRLDREVGRVLDGLDRAGLASSTLVVLTADHGEELLEHGFVGHASTSGEAKFTTEILKIPLIVRGPGVRAGTIVSSLAQNVDVTPTLLDLLGLAGGDFDGVSHRQDLSGLSGSAPVRNRVFFSSAIGGARTGESRRSERLDGVSDGETIHSERSEGAPPAGVVDPKSPELARELDRWRARCALRRLEILARFGGTSPRP